MYLCICQYVPRLDHNKTRELEWKSGHESDKKKKKNLQPESKIDSKFIAVILTA